MWWQCSYRALESCFLLAKCSMKSWNFDWYKIVFLAWQKTALALKIMFLKTADLNRRKRSLIIFACGWLITFFFVGHLYRGNSVSGTISTSWKMKHVKFAAEFELIMLCWMAWKPTFRRAPLLNGKLSFCSTMNT